VPSASPQEVQLRWKMKLTAQKSLSAQLDESGRLKLRENNNLNKS